MSEIFFSDQFANLKIEPIPEAIKPTLSLLTNGNFNHENVIKLLGNVKVLNNEQVKRKIKSPLFSVAKVQELMVPGVDGVFHVSMDKTGRLWVSDDNNTLLQIDLHGNQLQKIQTNGSHGFHTVTQNGDLLYAILYENFITRANSR